MVLVRYSVLTLASSVQFLVFLICMIAPYFVVLFVLFVLSVLGVLLVPRFLIQRATPTLFHRSRDRLGGMSTHFDGKLWQEKVIPRFSGTAPNAYTEGDIASFPLYAGQSVGMVHDILPAGAVVVAMVEGAKSIIRGRLSGLVVV